MRHALGVLGVLAAGVLLAVSAAMNWQFGYHLGRTPFDSQIMGAASAAADCMKALVPFFFFAAWRERMWSQAVAAALVWAVVTGYSLTSALGYAALTRADKTGERTENAQTYADLRAALKHAQDELSWSPQHRAAEAIVPEMASIKSQKAWVWSEGCTKLDGKAERQLCDKYHALESELASAKRALVLEKQVADFSASLANQTTHTGSSAGDPQAVVLTALLSKVFGPIQMADVQTMMSVMVALLLEVGSGLGMYVAFSQWRLHDVKAPSAPRIIPVAQAATINTAAVAVAAQPAVQQQLAKPRSGANDNKSAPAVAVIRHVAPETDVERFYKESIEVTDGSSLTATELYEDYCSWCEAKSKEPLALPTFGRAFGELGVKKEKIAGRIRYIGIALKSGQELSEDKKTPVIVSVAA